MQDRRYQSGGPYQRVSPYPVFLDFTNGESVGNLAHVHFAANIFDLPLKSDENPAGLFTEQELYMIAAVIFTAIFFDFEPSKSFQLRMVAHKLSMMLGKVIEANVKITSATGLAAKLTDGLRENKNALAEYGVHMVRQLIASGLSTYEIAFSQILPTACAMVPNQGQVVSTFPSLWNEAEFHSSLKSWTTISEKALNTGQGSISSQWLTLQKTMRS